MKPHSSQLFTSSSVPPLRGGTVEPRHDGLEDGRARRSAPTIAWRFGRPLVFALIVLLSSAFALARDNLYASAYGPFARDLLRAFHAEESNCSSAVESADVCFVVDAVGAGHLAEVLESTVDEYRSAGLRLGDWTSANGVWAVELRFAIEAYGGVAIYLTEVGHGVRGMLVLSRP